MICKYWCIHDIHVYYIYYYTVYVGRPFKGLVFRKFGFAGHINHRLLQEEIAKISTERSDDKTAEELQSDWVLRQSRMSIPIPLAGGSTCFNYAFFTFSIPTKISDGYIKLKKRWVQNFTFFRTKTAEVLWRGRDFMGFCYDRPWLVQEMMEFHRQVARTLLVEIAEE